MFGMINPVRRASIVIGMLVCRYCGKHGRLCIVDYHYDTPVYRCKRCGEYQ